MIRPEQITLVALATFLFVAEALSTEFSCVVDVPGADVGWVIEILPEDKGVRLIGARQGLFQLEDGSVTPVPGGKIGRVYEILPEDKGVRLIGARQGLFQLEDGSVTPVPGGEIGQVLEILPEDKGDRLIRTDQGLFQLEDGSVTPVPGEKIDWVYEILPEDKGDRLIGARQGLFQLEDGSVTPVPGGEIDQVLEILPEDKGERLIRTDQGLFQLEDGSVTPVPGGKIIWIDEILPEDKGVRLIRARHGLFQLEDGSATPVPGGKIGQVYEILPEDKGVRLIRADQGLFQLEDGSVTPVPGGKIGQVYEILPEDKGDRLIGARQGLFQLKDGWVTPVPGGEIGQVYEILPEDKGVRLIRADQGLFQLEDGSVTSVPGGEIGRVYEILPEDKGVRLIRARQGLFQLEDGSVTPVPGGKIGQILEILPEDKGVRLIRADQGLFQLYSFRHEVLMPDIDRDASNNNRHRFEWQLHHPCHEFLPREGLFRVTLNGTSKSQTATKEAALPGAATNTFRVEDRIRISEPDDNIVRAVLEARSSLQADDWEALAGSEVHIKVGWTPWDHVLHKVRMVAPWIAAFHSLMFGCLILAARRSEWTWRVMTDPIWGKVGAWFWLAFRHVAFVQRWILTRWFDAIRAKTTQDAYLPMPLLGPQHESLISPELADALSSGRRIWLQGVAGMGKTALVAEIVARYFRDNRADSLSSAFAKYGYVPLPIALRDYRAVQIPPAPEQWLIDVVGRAMEASGFQIDDQSLLRSILTTGYFVLILDGANEVDDGGAIEQFARRYPNVGLLVTSQTEPTVEASNLFELWNLPANVHDAAPALLELYLGQQKGQEAFAALRQSEIRRHVKSGYDVRLIADLIDGGVAPSTMPTTRLGIYCAMIDQVRPLDGSIYDVTDLCRIAWRCWSDGRRDLVAGDNVSASLLAPLHADGVRIVRTTDGRHHEFRHDQMRGYLAASWAALHEVAPINLFESEPQIWRLSRSEQQAVWEFFADLIDPDRGLLVLDWSTQEAERAELQVALRRVSKREKWPEGTRNQSSSPPQSIDEPTKLQ